MNIIFLAWLLVISYIISGFCDMILGLLKHKKSTHYHAWDSFGGMVRIILAILIIVT